MKIVNLNEAYLTENSWYEINYIDTNGNPGVGYAHLNNNNPTASISQLFNNITARHTNGLSNTYKNFTSFENSKNYVNCRLVGIPTKMPLTFKPPANLIITDMERSLRDEANDCPAVNNILTISGYPKNSDKLVHHINFDESDNTIGNLAIIINTYNLNSLQMNHFHNALHAMQDVAGFGAITPGTVVSIPVLTLTGAHTLNIELV